MACSIASKTKLVISPEDAKVIISRAIGGYAEVVDYQLEAFTDTKKTGFSALYKHLEITIKRQCKAGDNVHAEKLIFFVKCIPEGPPILVNALAEFETWKKEVEFFEQIAARLDTYAPGTGSWAPRCYLAKEDVIVLEDMTTRGFAIAKDDILFDEERLKSAARAQARLHAASYVTESILIKEQNKTLKDLAPIACREKIFDKTSELLEVVKALVLEWLGRVAEKNERKYEDGLLADSLDKVYDWLYFENGKNNVMCHGDTWAFNMLFDNSEPPKCRLIDFQLTRYGPRAFDLAQMTYFTTTSDMRAKYEASTLEVYHLEFCETLRKNGFEPITTLAELQEEYEEARLAALFASAIYYPFLKIGQNVFESLDDLYTKFIYRLNNDAVHYLMERDEHYREKLTKLTLELIDQCEKVNSKLKATS